MNEFIDITGMKIGKWSVLNYLGKGRYACVCECGAERIRDGRSIRIGRSSSCVRCRLADKHPRTTHGKSRTRLHRIWLGMRRRCLNENDGAYPRYGGRGILIDPVWNDFSAFLTWSWSNGYRDDLTLDRRDNDGNYEPGNCRWATYAEQNRNYSRVIFVEYDGEKVPLIDLSERFGLPAHTVRQRIQRYGWSVERALNTPSPRKATVSIGGADVPLRDACDAANLSPWMVRKRLKRGWSVDEALKP